jgi:hypothetical protein
MLTGSGLAPAGEAQRVMDIIPLKGEQSSITSRRTTGVSLQLNLLLAPLVVLGALAGRRILMRLNQRVFEELALGLSGIAALALLLA